MDKTLISTGYRLYQGREIDVYFNASKCQHSGNCVHGNALLFQLKRKPWIMPDLVSKDEVISCISRCPSGALVFRLKGEE